MKLSLTAAEVMRYAAEHPDLKLFTLRESRLFHVRISQAEPPGLRFDRYANGTYDTIKRADVASGVHVFNTLPADKKRTPSRYAGNHRAASYLAAFLNHTASAKAKALPSNEAKLTEFDGQGYGLSPEQRKAVEAWGMERASAHYQALGWVVEPRGKPFDLLCSKKSGEKHYVEVKASTGKLVEILVTSGEIDFACAHPDQVDLFLLEDVKLKGKCASGGKSSAFLWRCDRDRAVPTRYRYRLPKKK